MIDCLVKVQLVADYPSGITEVQIIQWYVEEGAHIEEWKPLCQYQSDKAVDDVSFFLSIFDCKCTMAKRTRLHRDMKA